VIESHVEIALRDTFVLTPDFDRNTIFGNAIRKPKNCDGPIGFLWFAFADD
jgi:hypothetical protein